MSKKWKVVSIALVLSVLLPVLLSAQSNPPRFPPYYEGDFCEECYTFCWPIPGTGMCEDVTACLSLGQNGYTACHVLFGFCFGTYSCSSTTAQGAENVGGRTGGAPAVACEGSLHGTVAAPRDGEVPTPAAEGIARQSTSSLEKTTP